MTMSNNKALAAISIWLGLATLQGDLRAIPTDQELAKLVNDGLATNYGIPGIPFLVRHMKPGDTSSGVEIARTVDTVSIDATPCKTGTKKLILTFVKPFDTSEVSDVNCTGRTYHRIQVIQH